MPVGELLTRISSRELSEWRAFTIIENEDQNQGGLANKSRAEAKQRLHR